MKSSTACRLVPELIKVVPKYKIWPANSMCFSQGLFTPYAVASVWCNAVYSFALGPNAATGSNGCALLYMAIFDLKNSVIEPIFDGVVATSYRSK